MTEPAFGIPTDRLTAIGEQYGTPVYVLDLDRFEQNLTGLSTALAPDRVYYSLKTNYLPDLLATVRGLGLGVDVVSGYELRAALTAGFAGPDIVFNGPVKSAAELELAVSAGAFVNIDSADEIEVLAGLAADRHADLDVGLRVFPPDDVYRTGSVRKRRQVPSKFGWPIEGGDADRLVDRISSTPGLRLTGIHCHLGSQIVDEQALLAAIGSVLDWLAGSDLSQRLTMLNLGGGFGVAGIRRHYGVTPGLSQVRAVESPSDPRRSLDVGALSASVRALLGARGMSGLALCWEPGRAAVSDAMTLLTTVSGVKHTTYGSWVVLDGGLNLLPTAGVAEEHQIRALRHSAEQRSYMVGGPLCYEGDVFSLDTSLPADLHRGELVTVHDAGAYSISRATSFNRPRAAVVAVTGDESRLCWRAEQDADIFRFQRSAGLAAAGITGGGR